MINYMIYDCLLLKSIWKLEYYAAEIKINPKSNYSIMNFLVLCLKLFRKDRNSLLEKLLKNKVNEFK